MMNCKEIIRMVRKCRAVEEVKNCRDSKELMEGYKTRVEI
jgi:hypothetical protein